MMSTTTSSRPAVAGHLAAAGVVVAVSLAAGGLHVWAGMLAFLGPLIVLLTVGRGDAFARGHALAAVRFNLSVTVYLAVIVAALRLTATGSPYTVQAVPSLFFCNLLIAFNWLVFTAIGAQRAATGQTFTYPMTLRAPGKRR
jgi:uncharacterized Tic20 family protein